MSEPGYTRKVVKSLLAKDRGYLYRLIGVELAPDATADTVCAIIADNNQTPEKVHKSSIYKCKCGSKMIASVDAQLRSADEGSTVLRTCRECGHTWGH